MRKYKTTLRKSRWALRSAVSVATLALSSGLAATDVGAQNINASPQAEGQRMVKSRILVKAKPGLSVAELDKMLEPHGGKRVQHLDRLDVHVVELPPTANAPAVIKALQSNPHIEFAEPDRLVKPDSK